MGCLAVLRLLSLAQTLATGNRPEKLRPSVVGRACPHSDTAATEPREAFGVRRIPALWMGSARRDAKAPEYGALQTLRALGCHSAFSFKGIRKIFAKTRSGRTLEHHNLQSNETATPTKPDAPSAAKMTFSKKSVCCCSAATCRYSSLA